MIVVNFAHGHLFRLAFEALRNYKYIKQEKQLAKRKQDKALGLRFVKAKFKQWKKLAAKMKLERRIAQHIHVTH